MGHFVCTLRTMIIKKFLDKVQYVGYSRSLSCSLVLAAYQEMHHSSIPSRKSEKMAFSEGHQKRAAGEWRAMNCWGRSVTASETIKGMDSVVIWIASRACIWYRKRGLGMCESERIRYKIKRWHHR